MALDADATIQNPQLTATPTIDWDVEPLPSCLPYGRAERDRRSAPRRFEPVGLPVHRSRYTDWFRAERVSFDAWRCERLKKLISDMFATEPTGRGKSTHEK
jgi:hypothetical protein